MCVAANAGSEVVAIGLPKCTDTRIASLLADLPAAIALATGAGSFIVSSLAFFVRLSGSFLWHAILMFNSSEPEPFSQPGLGLVAAGSLAV
jgi:hypothetical protein